MKYGLELRGLRVRACLSNIFMSGVIFPDLSATDALFSIGDFFGIRVVDPDDANRTIPYGINPSRPKSFAPKIKSNHL
jgi:hypothetical protein